MNPSRRSHLKAGAAGATALLVPGLASAGWLLGGPKAIELRPMRSVVWQDWLGVNTQFQWFAPEVARKQVDRLKALGLNWVRQGLHWMLLEPEPGKFKLDAIDQAMALVKSAGLRNITYVVGTPRFITSVEPGDKYAQYFDKFPPRDPLVYAQRMALLAKRYPQVDVWQVWNEPNILGFWAPKPDPQGYGRLLLPSVQALRATVPGKPVAMAGMAYFSEMHGGGLMLEAMGRLGAFNLDLIVAYHPYTAVAEGSSEGERDFVQKVTHAHQWLRAAKVRQIWATEWGWSSYDGPKEEQPIVGEQGQADHTLRRLALMAALDYDRVFLFTLSDLDRRASVRDQHYGLLRLNGEPKPLYHALSRFLAVCGPKLEPATPQRLGPDRPEGLVSISWRRADGRKLWMGWATEAGPVTLPGVQEAELHHPLKGTRTLLKAKGAEGVTVPLDTALQIVVYG
jgi:polysaccharide biosynthesis protein PslG